MFHPLAAEWFAENFGQPTAVQREAWPLLNEGKDVLAIAPTGSGKTLAAFLSALSRFIDGSWESEKLTVLYVSPLKALNEDIRRNLLEPIEGLRKKSESAPSLTGGRPFPDLRVETRSGDTPQVDRRRFLIRPPAVLALTPESLAILLLNPRGREILSTVKYLVLDEIHAVMGTKRGAFLACQIDRLKGIAGGFQRAALSATVNPPELAAEFAGCSHIVSPPAEKKIDFLVEFPDEPCPPTSNPADTEPSPDRYGKRYTVLVNYILGRIEKAESGPKQDRKKQNSSILVFTDSRRRAERIAYLVNRAAGKRLTLCHHGSLSKEVRRETEQSLAAGLIPCVVATSSLELGLDIGAVDEVILAGAPSSCAQTLQRIGRAGHGVGETSRGRLIPFHGMDLLLGAALAGAAADRELEKTRPVKNPLDILSQLVLALCAEKERNADELFGTLRGFQVFRELARSSFDQVIAMLTGNYFSPEEDSGTGDTGNKDTVNDGMRLRELKPRLYRDIDGTLHAAAGVLGLLYTSGGVIPNRGLYSLRLADGTKIGELDEEFVWERRIGDKFDFGARSWVITEIGTEAVTAAPIAGEADFSPFWKADVPFRGPSLCRRILEFLGHCNKEETPIFKPPVTPGLSGEAAAALDDFLSRQKEAQGIPFPDLKTIPVEIIDNPAVRSDSCQAVFHSFRGGAVNYPLAMALAGMVEEKTGLRTEAVPDDNAVLLSIPRIALPEGKLRGLAEGAVKLVGEILQEIPTRGEELFRGRLESSGVFGAAFREAAERSMILPGRIFGKRIPLWVMRQRAKRLFDRVRAYGDFPAVTEAWRSCLADRFDMDGFRALLEAIAAGTVRFPCFVRTSPSPFARELSWKETNSFMYEYDERKDLLGVAGTAGLSGGKAGIAGQSPADAAIAAALGDPFFRPPIRAESAASFGARLRRELPGWAPEDSLSLAQWVRDRIAIPLDEWKTLLEQLPGDLGEELKADPSLGGRLRELVLPGASVPVVVHKESSIDREGLLPRLGEWLRFQGPVSAKRIAGIFGLAPKPETDALSGLAPAALSMAEDALEALVEEGEAVKDITLRGIDGKDTGGLYCDRENFDLLLRISRKKARPRLAERPLSLLVPFTALRQGLINLREKESGPSACAGGESLSWLPALSCYPAPVRLWEEEIFPARDKQYRGENLENALREGRLIWYGAGKERAAFCSPEEWELAEQAVPGNPLAAVCGNYKSFWEIKDELVRRGSYGNPGAELSAGFVAEKLWEAVWAGKLSAGLPRNRRRESYDRKSYDRESPGSPAKRGIPAGKGIRGIIPSYRASGGKLPRALRERRQEGPVPGRWYSLETEPPEERPPEEQLPGESRPPAEVFFIEEDERGRERVRLLLRRWGILCRPLVETESCFSWAALLPAMRRMELAGELSAGRFFEGIPSLQFASPAIAEELEAAEVLAASGPLYWMNAADPASPAGRNMENQDRRLPARNAHSRLCFRGSSLIALSLKSGRELEIFIPPDDKDIPGILEFVKAPRTRLCRPVKKLALEKINGKDAAASSYREAFLAAGFIADRGRLFLW